MRKLVEEAILLDEPGDELPPVEGPALEVEAPEVGPEVMENAMSGLIANEIAAIYNSMDSLKGIIATLSSEMPGRDDISSILGKVLDERTVHIGMLQRAVDLIDGKSTGLIDDGERKADDVADKASTGEEPGEDAGEASDSKEESSDEEAGK